MCKHTHTHMVNTMKIYYILQKEIIARLYAQSKLYVDLQLSRV